MLVRMGKTHSTYLYKACWNIKWYKLGEEEGGEDDVEEKEK